MQHKTGKSLFAQEAALKAEIASYVYRWWLYGKGTFLDKDCNANNIGLANGAARACAKLQEARRSERERKRKGA